ncbi:MAG: hypothetical protein U0L38_06435, partial [Bacteroidales bacterium]|nr:hypothetical protein [Bacteroidales bacterium]
MNNRIKTLKMRVLLIIFAFCAFPAMVSAQDFDALRGDGLDFSHGYMGWTARTGDYQSSSSSSP